MIKIEKRRFHIPKDKQKAHTRRKKRRQKYREFMKALVSGLRKKEESKELRYCREEDRKKVLRRKGVRRRVKQKTIQKSKLKKAGWRMEWAKEIEKQKSKVGRVEGAIGEP